VRTNTAARARGTPAATSPSASFFSTSCGGTQSRAPSTSHSTSADVSMTAALIQMRPVGVRPKWKRPKLSAALSD